MSPDPRTKLLILAITGITVFLNENLYLEAGFVILPILLLVGSGHLRPALKGGAIFLFLVFVQFRIVPELPVSIGGIFFMFAVYIRKLIPCFLLGSYLIATTRVSTFLAAIGRLRLPKGLVIALSVTLRYFPTMKEEWGLIKDAMSLRGISVSFPRSLLHPFKTMEYVYVPMLVSASKISDEITQAAVTRGIDHVERRTCLEAVRFCASDVVLIAIYAAFVLLLIRLRTGGGVFS